MLDDTDSDEEIPPGWEERATLEGDVFYVNHVTKSTHWNHPLTGKKKRLSPELPYGWEIQQDDTGIVIFHDTINNKTTHTDPRLAFAEEISPKSREFQQRFDGNTNALQVLMGRDLRGKFAIVTGANTGIGFETARSLSMHGCHVTLACRDVTKGREAVGRILAERPEAQVVCAYMDLSVLRTIKNFAEQENQKELPLNYLILNAGVFSPPHTITPDGYELTFQVNHLGHHFLTRLLLPRLLKTTQPRVVVLSSESHRTLSIKESTMNEENLSPSYSRYYGMLHYGNTKLCNILFARQLHIRYYEEGLRVYSCHPGNMVSSDFGRNWWFYRLLFFLVRPFTKTLQQAAATTIYCAVHRDTDVMSGQYYVNCCPCQPSTLASNDDVGKELWRLSEDMISKANSLTDPSI